MEIECRVPVVRQQTNLVFCFQNCMARWAESTWGVKTQEVNRDVFASMIVFFPSLIVCSEIQGPVLNSVSSRSQTVIGKDSSQALVAEAGSLARIPPWMLCDNPATKTGKGTDVPSAQGARVSAIFSAPINFSRSL